jgi:voltage-dependent calcium channel alpha-2/delta-3
VFSGVFSGVPKNDSLVDMFDCRMRLWYIDASLSPKDVIILVDNSGSMTGTSHEIARHVVNSILETLGSNDFVNVLMFNDTVAPVISCLRNDTLILRNDTLIQVRA